MPPAVCLLCYLTNHWTQSNKFVELLAFTSGVCKEIGIWLVLLNHLKWVKVCVVLQAAASCYIELVVKESDNNVKLIVLDRLVALKEVPAHEKVLQVKHYIYTQETGTKINESPHKICRASTESLLFSYTNLGHKVKFKPNCSPLQGSHRLEKYLGI